ncbi:hypothetical protein OAU50_05265 [Planctomycetota bacterium]|nr:hypothetical protein [Planctomycetota bacterium]
MRYLPLAIAFVVLALAVSLTGCTTTQKTPTPFKGIEDPVKLEKAVHEYIGDVSVHYYVKRMSVEGTRGDTVEQKESHFTLVNRDHTFYQNQPEHEIAAHVFFLSNADMYNLLTVLKHKAAFFDSGNSINILADDPVARANSEPSTTRIIAVEQIHDGKVDTSYFNRRSMEHEIDKDRARRFNYAQDYILEAVRQADPRGSSGAGKADTWD